MKYISLCVLLIFISFHFVSCREELSQKDKTKLIDVLESIHECEAYVELKHSAEYHQTLSDCKQEVFRMHHISEQEFSSLMSKLKNNPEEMDRMYDTIIVQLERKELK